MDRINNFLRRESLAIRHDLLLSFFAILATLAIIPIITYLFFAKDLTSKEKIMNKNSQGVILLDRNDKPFFSFYKAQVRDEIVLSEIPKLTKEAFIATEDKDFYYHPGFSLKSIVRSVLLDVRQKSLSYGGSTITQQLVKNSLLSSKKEFLRKYQEIVLASEIERRYKKDEILEMYLNSVYLGQGAFGLENAANTYFNKKARDLSLAQSAILAAILPAPSSLSLINGNFAEAKKRQVLVLEKMLEQKYITAKQKDEAQKEKIVLVPNQGDMNIDAPHFALMVKDALVDKYGEEFIARSGFKVKTTLDLDWQKYAETVVERRVEELKGNHATNGAAIVMDSRTGEIRVLVGSANWYNEEYGKVNIALSNRSPGSSFKPIVYIRAMERQFITPATILKDEPTRFANFDENKFFASFPTKVSAQENLRNDPNAFYSPQDYDRKFRGPVTVRRALSNSLNVPAVEVMKKVGVDDVVSFAKTLGLSTLKDPSNYGLSLVLGSAEVKPLELTNVYATIANKGYMNTPTLILEINDKSGNSIYNYQPNQQKVIDEKYTFLISSILSDNTIRAEVFGNALNISRPAAVKTGTAESYKDAWTMGFTPSLTAGVWVGNNSGEPMDGVAGSLGAAPIWKDLMEKFLSGTPVEQFEVPPDVIKAPLCLKGTPSVPSDFFIRGTEPKQACLPVPTLVPVQAPKDTKNGNNDKNRKKD